MSEFVLLILDPDKPRRLKIIDELSDFSWAAILGAATWGETYLLVQTHMPFRIAVASEAIDPKEFITLSELITTLGADLVLYGEGSGNISGHQVIPFGAAETSERLVTALSAGISPPLHSRVKTVSNLLSQRLDSAGEAQPKTRQMILVGASTGGISALETVLREFSANCPPTLIVQHIRSGFADGLVRRLDQSLAPKIVAAEDGMPLQSGVIYFATDPSRHLGVTYRGIPRAKLSVGPAVEGHCPSVDVLFQQAASYADRFELRAALLTGMGADGAGGMVELKRAGAFTIAQDQESSVVWGMPRVAIEKGGVCEILPLSRIGQALLRPLPATASLSARQKI